MASTYQQVGYGSTGTDVRKLQSLLNKQGYALEEDGIFGEKTQAAVKNYQKKNGLLLDGIAGNETWGSLLHANSQQQIAIPTASASSAPSSPSAASVLSSILASSASIAAPAISAITTAALQKTGKGYSPSNEVKAAQEVRKSLEETKPAAYVSGFDDQLSELYDQMAQREAFRYDPAEDPVYQSYAKQYQRQGKLAMEDTMGKAAGLTGGYGSTYAENAAQQAYESYLAKLQDVVPALQENAWQQYKAQGDALLQRYDKLKEQDSAAYERWRDEVSDWQKAVNAAQEDYEFSANADMKTYQMLLDYYADQAASAMKAAQNGMVYPVVAVSSIGNTSSLSSTASDSLERAMGNYLKSGNSSAAAALYAQYRNRMTPNQLKSFARLFSKYGVTPS